MRAMESPRSIFAIAAGRAPKWVVFLVWLVGIFIAVGPAQLPTKFMDAENNESTSYLPGDAESTKALEAEPPGRRARVGGHRLLPRVGPDPGGPREDRVRRRRMTASASRRGARRREGRRAAARRSGGRTAAPARPRRSPASRRATSRSSGRSARRTARRRSSPPTSGATARATRSSTRSTTGATPSRIPVAASR